MYVCASVLLQKKKKRDAEEAEAPAPAEEAGEPEKKKKKVRHSGCCVCCAWQHLNELYLNDCRIPVMYG